jgi:hypothetical protein
MTILRQVLVLCLFVLYGITAVSAAGNGTFSIPAVTGINVSDNLTATVYLENTWSPKAADVYMHITYDSSLLNYTGADFKIGNTVAATKDADNSIFLQFGDFTNGYPNGRFAIADLKFMATGAGISPLTVSVDHVRYYVNDTPVDIGDTAAVVSGTVTIGSGITNVTPTVTVPNTTVPTIVPNNTTTIVTTIPTIVITTTPLPPVYYSGSNDYTGVVATTALPTTTAPVTTTPMIPGVTMTMTPTPNETIPQNGTTPATTTPTSTATSTATVLTSPSATVTTPAGTAVPVNTTTTQAAGPEFGLLSLASIGAAALFIGRRLR